MMRARRHEQRLRWWAALLGFDLVGFDAWLATLPAADRRQFADRRQRAAAATTDEAARRHLEAILHGAKLYRLRPTVARDEARQAGTRAGRNPIVAAFVEQQLRDYPADPPRAMWARAGDRVKDRIGYSRFRRRVAAERKKTLT